MRDILKRLTDVLDEHRVLREKESEIIEALIVNEAEMDSLKSQVQEDIAEAA